MLELEKYTMHPAKKNHKGNNLIKIELSQILFKLSQVATDIVSIRISKYAYIHNLFNFTWILRD